MVAKGLSERLGRYFARLGEGRAEKIKARDVEKVIAKLRQRLDALSVEAEQNPQKAERIAVKRRIAEDLLLRAEWLLSEIERGATPPLSPLPRRED